MDSTALISNWRTRSLPLLAILRHDLRTLASSWLVRLWLLGSLIVSLLTLSSGWSQLPSSHLIAALLFPYLVFPWFLVVMVLGVSPISGARVEALADGFLSRPITRYEFLLGIWAARVLVVLGAYLVIIVPTVLAVALGSRRVAPDGVTYWGIIASLGVVGLVLALQVSLAFLTGIVLRRSLLAVVVLLCVWYPVNMIFNNFQLESISPITLSRAIPTLLRQPWSGEAAPTFSLSASEEAIRAVGSLFSGMVPGSEAPPRPRERRVDHYFGQTFDDFSLLRVLLGYGLPTLAALGLATLWFSVRDL
jgi:hypothetical protein